MLRPLVVICVGTIAMMSGPALAETSGSDLQSAAPATQHAQVAAQEETDPDPAAKPMPAGQDATAPAIGEAAKATATPEDKPASAAPAEPTLTASVDLGKQTMVVSENGEAKYSWPISSGTSEYPTPRGTFRPQWTAKMWYSRKYDNAPMPHAVFISGGVAVHATPYTRSLGRPASHGCIRLAPTNAKTFYGLVQRHGLKMTKVSVFGSPKWREPAVASRDDSRPRRAVARVNNSYRTTSAYDPGFAQRRAYRPPAQVYYTYPGDYPARTYRRYGGNRYVYVQRPRRVYYYNNYGYGYGGGGW